MGTLSSLDSGVMDAVEHIGLFLKEEDAVALSQAVLGPKPLPRPIPEPVDLVATGIVDPLAICSVQ